MNLPGRLFAAVAMIGCRILMRAPAFHPRSWRQYSFGVSCRFLLMRSARSFPLHQLQIEDEDGVQHRHQKQSDESRHAKSADLRITKRLPQWLSVQGEREK